MSTDFREAYKWLSLAKTAGWLPAHSELSNLKDNMNPAVIAEAQKLAAEWKPKK